MEKGTRGRKLVRNAIDCVTMFVMWPDLSERLTGIKWDEECEGDTRGEETQAEQQQVGHLLSVHADSDTLSQQIFLMSYKWMYCVDIDVDEQIISGSLMCNQ